MKYIAVCILLFLISLNKLSLAQDIHVEHIVKGCVVDKTTKDTIPGARVCLYQQDSLIRCKMAGMNGCFEIKTNVHGDLILNVQFPNYDEYVHELSFNKQAIFNSPIELLSKDALLPPVYIGTAKAADYQKLTGTATNITKKEIIFKNPIGTGEILQEVPGLYVAGDDGFGNSRLSVGIRGLNPRRSARTLILEDGVPIQPNAYIYPNVYYNPPIERIEKIEVIKGSGAIKYGPQTMGGVINYITSYPTRKFGGLAKTTIGNNGYLSTYAQVSGFGNAKFVPEVQLLYKRGNGYRRNNEFDQINATFKSHIILNEHKKVYVKLNYNDEFSNATYTGLTEFSYAFDPRFNPKKNDEFSVRRAALDLIYKNTTHDSLVGITKLYANYFDRDWWREDDVFISASSLGAYLSQENPTVGSSSGITSQSPFSTGDKVRVGNGKSNFGILRTFYVFGVEQDYALKHKFFGKKAKLDFGGRYHLERFQNRKRIGDSPTDRVGILWTEEENDGEIIRVAAPGAIAQNYESWALSGYIEEELNLTEKLLLNAGVRLELFEQTQIDLLNNASVNDKTTMVVLPGLGFNYALSKSTNLFGGVHRGYTPPSSGTFAVFSNDIITESLNNFTAEKSINYEVGFRHNSSLFYTESALFLVDISDIATPARNYVFQKEEDGALVNDLGHVQTRGLETSGKIKFHNLQKSFAEYLPDLTYSYTLLFTEIIDGNIAIQTDQDQEIDELRNISGNELSYAPRHTLLVGLEKKLFRKKIRLGVTAQYVAETFSDLENYTQDDIANNSDYFTGRGDAGPIPSYTLIHVNILYRYNKNWRVGLNVKNLTDEVYIASRLHSNPSRTSAGQSSGILVGPRRQVNLSLTYKF